MGETAMDILTATRDFEEWVRRRTLKRSMQFLRPPWFNRAECTKIVKNKSSAFFSSIVMNPATSPPCPAVRCQVTREVPLKHLNLGHIFCCVHVGDVVGTGERVVCPTRTSS